MFAKFKLTILAGLAIIILTLSTIGLFRQNIILQEELTQKSEQIDKIEKAQEAANADRKAIASRLERTGRDFRQDREQLLQYKEREGFLKSNPIESSEFIRKEKVAHEKELACESGATEYCSH